MDAIKWRRVNVQFIAGLGDPHSSSGTYGRLSCISVPSYLGTPAAALADLLSIDRGSAWCAVFHTHQVMQCNHARAHSQECRRLGYLACRPRPAWRPHRELFDPGRDWRGGTSRLGTRPDRLVGRGIRPDDGEARLSTQPWEISRHW